MSELNRVTAALTFDLRLVAALRPVMLEPNPASDQQLRDVVRRNLTEMTRLVVEAKRWREE